MKQATTTLTRAAFVVAALHAAFMYTCRLAALACTSLSCDRESLILRLDVLINQPLRHLWRVFGGQEFRFVERVPSGLIDWLGLNLYTYVAPPVMSTTFASLVSLGLFLLLRKGMLTRSKVVERI